jgi:prepilin-type N-terminal cleavage/methylation domain-containing protein
MKIESIKRCHWMIIGVVIGIAIAYGQFSLLGEKHIGLGVGKMTQIEFERELRAPPVAGLATFKEIRIYPRHEHDRVELQRLQFSTTGAKYSPAFFIADRPYVPRGKDTPPHPRYSVRDLMAGTMPRDQLATVKYAWWQARAPRIIMGSVAGLAVVGGLWPMLLRMLVSAGYRRGGKKSFEAKPERVASNAAPIQVAAKAANIASLEHLRELEEEMMRNLRSKTADAPTEQPAPATTPSKPEVRKLEGDDHVKPPTHTDEDHLYRGEFYPVDRAHHPDPHEKPSAKKAFTLIELLVVIGLIALLLSLLIPALRIARQQAEQVKCAAQLRELDTALRNYAHDYKGSMPNWSWWQTYPDGTTSDDSPGLGWTEILAQGKHYVRPDSPMYNCPSFPSSVPMRNYFLAAKWAGKRGRSSMRFDEIKLSSYFIISGDKTQLGLYPLPAGTAKVANDDCDPDDFGDDRPVMAWPWEGGGFWMHRGGNNILFADHSVRLYKRYDRFSMTFHPTEMKDWTEVE